MVGNTEARLKVAPQAFPGWARSPLAGSEDPWYVNFANYNPMTDHWDQAEERWVRCVRLTPEATR
ncbi:MAG: hypothetical protein KIT72_02045 [Polyangiaceae bacterium]|nr:hypothetical protein [Polyangiaceae bacterium]MCW5789180.1 hypothetical protein [Polyangiaceae bacterium]